MHDTPQRNRMPCLLLHGDSGMGKSMVIAKFRRAHPPVYDPRTGIEHHCVIAMEMPAAPSQRRFYAQLLQAINAPYRPSDRLETLEFTTIRLLTAIAPRMLFVDEIRNLLSGIPREQRAALNLLKFVSNKLNCCIVVCGTRDALVALQSDDQMTSRFRPFELTRWQESEEFSGFVRAFEKTLLLRQKSNLGDKAVVHALLDATHGVTGSIADVLAGAARAAIRSGAECITADLIRAEARYFSRAAA